MDPIDALLSAVKYVAVVCAAVLAMLWLSECDVGPPADWGLKPLANACEVK